MSELKKYGIDLSMSPYQELMESGITEENWLDNLDNLADEEVTAMLNLAVKDRRWDLDDSREKFPNITDRQRAELMRGFVI